MAAQYDALGNYLGDWETEEERRKREEEYANTAVRTQEIKTYGDGTVERTTKEEMAPAIQPVAVRPVQQTPVAQPVRPVVPDQAAYNAAIQRQESGARPDIGFHNQQLSSAYGPYGITAGAYQDARRVNPELPADITQATPEQMTAAQNAVTANNARYLQNYGVEVNPNTLAAAHFLGAKGLADYLQTGAISPQAAAANGGVENVKRIVDQRLGGQVAPASGAAQLAPGEQAGMPTAPVSPYDLVTGRQGPGLRMPMQGPTPTPGAAPSMDFINAYQQDQDNPMNLLKLREDQNAPSWIRERAGERAYDLMNQEVKKKEAEQQAKLLATGAAMGDRKAANTIAKELQNQEGSWLKMILLGFISPQLAGEEAIKLGFGNKWVQGSDQEGNPALIQVNAKGLPLKGYKNDGSEIAANELVAYGAGAGRKVTTSGTFFQGPNGQILRAQSDEQGRTRLVDAASGARYTGPTSGLTKLEEAGALRKMDRGLVIDLAKKHGQNVLEAEKEYVSINGPFKSPEERQQFRQAYGYDLAQPAAVPGVAGFPGAQAAPSAAPAQVARPVAPGQVPQAPAAMPGAPAAIPPGAVTQPLAGMQTGVAINRKQQEEFVKYSAEDITPKADAGGQVSRIRKEQIKGPDGILNNPEIAGLLQGGSGEVGNIIRDLVTGNFKDQADLSARVASLNLTDRQKEVLYRQINLATQVNPQTLKANAGAGAVSDAEQKANRAANIDVTRQPLYSGLADLSRSQFVNDLSVARQEFRAARPDLQTTEQFNRAWSQEKSKIQKQYDQVFEARAAYIAKHNKDGKNPGAVVDAFKYYPTPEWNSETRSWDLGTDYARKAARPKLTEFVR